MEFLDSLKHIEKYTANELQLSGVYTAQIQTLSPRFSPQPSLFTNPFSQLALGPLQNTSLPNFWVFPKCCWYEIVRKEKRLRKKNQRIDCDSGHHLTKMSVENGENVNLRMKKTRKKGERREQEPERRLGNHIPIFYYRPKVDLVRGGKHPFIHVLCHHTSSLSTPFWGKAIRISRIKLA